MRAAQGIRHLWGNVICFQCASPERIKETQPLWSATLLEASTVVQDPAEPGTPDYVQYPAESAVVQDPSTAVLRRSAFRARERPPLWASNKPLEQNQGHRDKTIGDKTMGIKRPHEPTYDRPHKSARSRIRLMRSSANPHFSWCLSVAFSARSVSNFCPVSSSPRFSRQSSSNLRRAPAEKQLTAGTAHLQIAC